VNYTFFCRAKTRARCLTGDLTVDRPPLKNCLFVRKSKGDQRRDTRDKLVLAIPIPANPILADFLDSYTRQRKAFYATCYKRTPLTIFGASHLLKPPPNGEPPQHFPRGWPLRSAQLTPTLKPALSGHRTTTRKGPHLLPAASPPPSRHQIRGWLGQEQLRDRRKVH
jgi:hypothetical protein